MIDIVASLRNTYKYSINEYINKSTQSNCSFLFQYGQKFCSVIILRTILFLVVECQLYVRIREYLLKSIILRNIVLESEKKEKNYYTKFADLN